MQKYMVNLSPDQIYKMKDSKIHYEEVVNTEGIDANELYLRSKLFIANAYVSSSDVTKFEDKENGIIIVKALFPHAHNKFINRGRVTYTLKIEVKDNRYKYTITDLRYKFNIKIEHINRDYDEDLIQWGFPMDGFQSKDHYDSIVKFHNDIHLHFSQLSNSIKEAMAKPRDTDW